MPTKIFHFNNEIASTNGLCYDLDRSCGELDSDSRLGLEVELVPGEPGQKVGLTHPGVADQNH